MDVIHWREMQNNHFDLSRSLAEKDLELWCVTSWTWVSNDIAVRALSTEIRTPCCEKQPSHHGAVLPAGHLVSSCCFVLFLRPMGMLCVWFGALSFKGKSGVTEWTWSWLPWKRLPGGAIIGFKREICSLYSWCKKLSFSTWLNLNCKAGRIWENSLRGRGVFLTAFSNRQVRSVRFMESFGALFPMDYSGCSSRAEFQPLCEGKAPSAALSLLWIPDKCSLSLGGSRRMLQSRGKLRLGGMCSIYLHPCFCPNTNGCVERLYNIPIYKIPVLLLHISRDVMVSLYLSAGGLYLHLWFLWGSAFVLKTSHGWDWCYKAVGGSSPCRERRQESITYLLRAWFAAFLIWDGGSACSFCCCLLVPGVGTTSGTMWCLQAPQWPQSMKWAKLNTTIKKKNLLFCWRLFLA